LELLRQEFERLSPGETVLELEPVVAAEADNFHALRVLGLSYVQLGRVREGLTLVERAVALHANQPDGWYTFAWCLYETGDLERLGRAWIEMPDSVRLDARLLRYRGMWAEKSAHPADAEAAYRSALERAPADRKAHYQLARVLRHRGAEQEAAEHEIAARSLDDSREALATCYTRAKQQHDNPGAELCREIGRLCRALGRIPLAVCWDREADRRT
jgi:tetratricopeptide (TPR) repeat protein